MKTSLFYNSTEPAIRKSRGFKSKFQNCIACNDSHPVYACLKFNDINEDAHNNLICNCHKYFRCLGLHLFQDCISLGSFKSCGNSNHHILLHRSRSTVQSYNKGGSTKY